MSTVASPAAQAGGRGTRVSPLRKRADLIGDRLLFGVCLLAALIAAATIFLVGYQIVHGAQPAISKFGLGFVTSTEWQPNFGVFGAGVLLFGTAVTSAFALFSRKYAWRRVTARSRLTSGTGWPPGFGVAQQSGGNGPLIGLWNFVPAR